ncbi:DUF4358 domain-containing protein [Alloiococcus sp. CFN-8]|uniref:DUF4358 domain-containing protein n=1 Tax=Alloiococcus sp. CFN-8 TaxID=3416081 RepID=UPI003CF9D6E8
MKKIVSLLCAGVLALGIFTGCTSGKDKDASYESGKLQEILAAVKEEFGDMYYPAVSYEAEHIDTMYGIKEDSYEEAFAEVPMININIDTFIGVEAKEGKVEEVRAALDAYRDKIINTDVQYPGNLLKAKASKVYTRGNYVFFICIGQVPQDMMESTEDEAQAEAIEEAQIKAIEEGNDRAIEVINSILK